MSELVKWKDPISKLIEVVSNAFGVLYRPRAIRKDAKAQADAIIEMSKAQAIADGESKLIELDYENIIQKRRKALELRRQNNIDDVVEMALSQIETVETVSEQNVDEDWTSRFFDYVKDISNKEMKLLWGKILAGEVKSPNSYSLRTLDLLRNLSKEEALIFSKAAQYVIRGGGEYFIFNDGKNSLFPLGLNFHEITILVEAGLVQSETLMQSTLTPIKGEGLQIALIYGDKVIIIKSSTEKTFSIPYYRLTKAGSELFHLIDTKANIDYIKLVANYLKKDGLSFEYGDLISENNNIIEYSDETVKLY